MRELRGAVVRFALIAAVCLCGMSPPLLGPAVAAGCCADIEARVQQSPSTDDITIIDLGARMSDAALHSANLSDLRLNLACGRTSDLSLLHFADSADSLRGAFIGGFGLSAAAGGEDI